MNVTIHNDDCETVGVMQDVDKDDLEQLRAELPAGQHIAGIDCEVNDA